MHNPPESTIQPSYFQTFRRKIADFVESKPVLYGIVFLILVNAASLGLMTVPTIQAEYGELLLLLDTSILAVFVIEIILKLIAFDWRFFKNGWNVFDFMIISIALIPFSGDLAILRVLRVLRLLRALSVIPNLRLVVEALLKAVPGISSILVLILVFYYIFAVIATKTFGEAFPEWFGTLASSMYTLFQIMTLESWSMGIARPVMEQFEYAWIFFVVFILIASFTMLNLFVAVMVDTMQSLHAQEHQEELEHIQEDVHEHMEQLTQQIVAMREEMQELKVLMRDLSDK